VRTLIIEADGASRGNPGDASYGALVRDAETGELLAEVASVLGRTTNNVAEYHGVIAGLEAARAIDPDAAVEVRMDSKLVVEQLSGRWQVKHPAMKPLAERARRTFPAHSRITFSWIPRAQNSHADRLANEVLDAAADGRVWKSETPVPETPLPKSPVLAPAPASVPAPAAAPTTSKAAWGADLGAPTRLLLLRHGVTGLTGQKRFSGLGSGDPQLTETGLAQARAAAARLAGPGRAGDPVYGRLDAIVASPLRRTRQTAQAVADATGLEMRIEDDFRELDFGRFEGLTFAEAKDRYPDQVDHWLADAHNSAPDGESIEQVAVRAGRARDRMVARFPRCTVLVVTHVTPIKTLVCLALQAPLAAVHRMELSAASITALDLYEDGAVNLRCFNDTAHLLPLRSE
jgi:ribonuclease H / adenosylcobalamin/alpha-ribazole phosphatase